MKSHRGLSAVVGTVFLVAVVIAALSYVSYSLDVMGNFSQSLIVEESRQRDKQSEAFEISSIDVTALNKLDGIIKNTGEIPVKITTLYIDEQGVNDVVQKFTLDAEIAPGNTVDLASLVDFTMDSAKGYNMKVVSSRGEVNSFYVNSLADENVYMLLTATPSIIPSTFTTTLLFTVVNNMSNGNYLYNLTPAMNDTRQTLDPSSTGMTMEKLNGPTPLFYESLGPGEVAVFTYDYALTGSPGDTQIFNVTLANANPGNEAISTATIRTVPLATDAGSALLSLGLTDSSSTQADVLYFHAPGSVTPNNEFPMDGTSPNSAGITQSPNGNTLEFITSGMIVPTTLPIGEFTAALNYFSSPVPLDFPEPSFAFMMEGKDRGDWDEIADIINLFDDDRGFKERDDKPDWSEDIGQSNQGPDGSNFFHFDGNQWEYFDDDFDVNHASGKYYTEPQLYPDTDAIWVRIESDYTITHQSLIRFGDKDAAGDDEYGIAVVTNGEIRYGWDTDRGNGDSVYCTTVNEYDDGLWHHIVGVRDGPYSCKLYIDGGFSEYVENTSSPVGGDNSIDVDWIGIASEDTDGDEADFNGDIANWIHWNNDALTAAQVEDLYYTNYGTNATRLNMTVERVDDAGTTVLETIIPSTKIELPFHDPSLGNTNDEQGAWIGLYTGNTTDAKYMQANMTESSSSVISFDTGERLKLTLEWNEDEQNIPINIMWDDSGGWSLPEGPSYLQTPPPNPRWPTFLTFAYDDLINYFAYNEGPGGIWFVFSGTRLVLTTNDQVSSFAAVPKFVNKTTQPSPSETYAALKPDQDSIYIPALSYAEIEFYQLQSPPSRNDNPPAINEVPSGDYDAALYIQGYDEAGETFKKTIDLGLIHITGNP
ncbi:MAG: hypothetical protein K5777_01560 [Nitrosopumilus sp.]|nr:hypothetical protein [Nitrosopumilus sp.]